MAVHRLADMHYSRLFHGVCLLNNQIYVTGGINDVGFVNFCERYSIQHNMWVADVAKLPDSMFNHTLLAVDSKWLYSFGGLA